MTVATDQSVEVYRHAEGNSRYVPAGPGREKEGNSWKAGDSEGGQGQLPESSRMGLLPIEDVVEEDESFCQHLMGYREGWFSDNSLAPDGIKWIPEAMQRGVVLCVMDGFYIKHVAPNISDAGWILQDRRIGKRVRGSSVELPHSAGRYRQDTYVGHARGKSFPLGSQGILPAMGQIEGG